MLKRRTRKYKKAGSRQSAFAIIPMIRQASVDKLVAVAGSPQNL